MSYIADPNKSGSQIPAGTNEGYTPNSGSDGWNYSNLPTTDPGVKGSLWQDASASYVLKVSQG